MNATTFVGIAEWSNQPGGSSRVNVTPIGFLTYGAVGDTFPTFALVRASAAPGNAYNDLVSSSWGGVASDTPLVRTRLIGTTRELYLGGDPTNAADVVDGNFIMGSEVLFQNAASWRWNIDNTVVNQNGLTQLDQIGSIQSAAPAILWDSVLRNAPSTPNSVVHVWAVIEGFMIGGAKGAAFVLSAAFRVVAGVFTQIGTTTVVSVHRDDPTWDATITNTPGAIQVDATSNGDLARWSGRVWSQAVTI